MSKQSPEWKIQQKLVCLLTDLFILCPKNVFPKLSMPHGVDANNFPEKKTLCPLKPDFQSKLEIDCKVSYNEVLVRKESDHNAH